MAENKMKEVAKILGVEMGVPFKVKGHKEKFVIKDYGMKRVCTKLLSNGTLINILCGREEIEQSILDEVEKRYLEGVIRPFKDKVVGIERHDTIKHSFIRIYTKFFDDNRYIEYMCLPYFKKDTMYKGMEVDKEYTLEELGLFE